MDVGQQVYWYPKGAKYENTIPRIGFASAVHPKGIIDITVLPTQDGTCEYIAHVFPHDDPRLTDHLGNISSAGRERGFYEVYKPANSRKKAE